MGGMENNRVLVIDDEEAVCRAINRLLRARFTVVMADSGPRALEILRRDDGFAAIILDLVMPEVSGMDVVEWIEKNRPHLCEHVVVLTGGVFDGRGKDFLERWQGLLLEKPFDPARLLAVVEEAIGGRG